MKQVETAPMGVSHGRGRSGNSGFTLIELMVVVAVVAILAAIALPAYQEQVRKSRRGQAQADIVELTQRAERFHTVNNTYDGFWDDVPSDHRVSPRTGSSFYDITAEEGDNTFTLTATPRDGTPQAVDRCGVMTIDQAGRKTHEGGSGRDDECKFGTTP